MEDGYMEHMVSVKEGPN